MKFVVMNLRRQEQFKCMFPFESKTTACVYQKKLKQEFALRSSTIISRLNC